MMWMISIVGLGAVVLFGLFLLIMSFVAQGESLLMEISEDMTDDEIDAVPTENLKLYNEAMIKNIETIQRKNEQKGE